MTTHIDDMRNVLNSAADLLEQDGWIQHYLYSAKGRCILGAISDATRRSKKRSGTAALARQHLHTHLNTTNAVEWNDHPERTQTEVVAALRAAATTEPSPDDIAEHLDWLATCAAEQEATQ